MRRSLGLALILLGIIGLLFGGLEYARHRDDVEFGPLVVQRVERKTIAIPPLVAAASLLSGAILLSKPWRGRREDL